MTTPTFSENLGTLRQRYPLLVGPLVILLAIGLAYSPMLAWTAGILFALATSNKIVPPPR